MRSNIYLRLAGGLGNQIFQFAAALRIHSIWKDHSSTIIVDPSCLANYKAKHKNYLPKLFATSFSFSATTKFTPFSRLRLPRILDLRLHPFLLFVNDSNYSSCITSSRPYKYVFLDDYFQVSLNQLALNESIACLKEVYSLPDSIDLADSFPAANCSCSLHIRGTDFLSSFSDISVCKRYYLRAIKYMQEVHSVTCFKVFTDDIPFALEILGDAPCVYEIASFGLLEDFLSIGMFHYQILSSSTFAFWASALGQVNPKVVITPGSWMLDKPRNVLLPSEIIL